MELGRSEIKMMIPVFLEGKALIPENHP